MCCVFDFSCAARLSGSEEEVEEYEEIEAVLHSEKKVVAIIQWNLSLVGTSQEVLITDVK